MFGYLLSFAIAFIFFGTVFNVLSGLKLFNLDDCDKGMAWFLILVCSALWFAAIPVFVVICIVLLLKKITDKISSFVLNKVKK